MKLFTYATSPYARKVRMALDYKRVSYEPLERCYSLDRKEDLRCAAPRAEVPTLVLDDGRTITDSTIISEYLEEVYREPALYPKDPYQRARMRTIEELCDRAFDAAGYGFWIAVLREAAPEAKAMKAAATRELAELLKVLERELGGQDFFCGKLSIADLAAICYVPGAASMGVDLTQTPRLRQWVQRMRAVAAVAADLQRLAEAVARMSITAELEGPDGRVHWRDSRLEWPIRHGFIDFVAREFHAGKMMFPPDAS
ncbi:MAG TPA: glutathione S-transferase family protein [Candidatus Binataceae bacterium]|nr:glutathione S-transferase family protein [Candidatus Binataceae bacterium]